MKKRKKRKKKLQSTSSSLDHPFQIPPARWQQASMLGNFERSGHEKGKEKGEKNVSEGWSREERKWNQRREIERERGNMKETRAVVECRDDNVRGKLMQRVTIRFICALSAVIDIQKAAIWNHREGKHCINTTGWREGGLNALPVKGEMLHVHDKQKCCEKPLDSRLWYMWTRHSLRAPTAPLKHWWLYHRNICCRCNDAMGLECAIGGRSYSRTERDSVVEPYTGGNAYRAEALYLYWWEFSNSRCSYKRGTKQTVV